MGLWQISHNVLESDAWETEQKPVEVANDLYEEDAQFWFTFQSIALEVNDAFGLLRTFKL